MAFAIRLFLLLAPIVSAFILAFAIARFLPPWKLGVNPWLWWIGVFCIANLYLRFADRWLSNFLPVATLFQLSLVFPDQAPSRFKTALRSTNSRKTLARLDEAKAAGKWSSEIKHSETMLGLVTALSDHDRMTRGHAERVQAYCDLIAEEMGLSDDDRGKLRWASLLHDMGKLEVPAEILNKKGRPDEREWQILESHPAAGRSYVEPLRPWLGDWLGAVDEHHCRWDGKGYPSNLKGNDITLAGRIAAVADAYDVMTSARSYKKPLSAEVARQELANGAGTQFDPTVVRSFLQLGIGRLRLVAGPLAWVAGATGSVPAPVVGSVAALTGAAAAVIGGISTGLLAPPEDPDLAFVEQPGPVVVNADPVTVLEDGVVTIVVEAVGDDDVVFRIEDSPDNGSWSEPSIDVDEPDQTTWSTDYRPDPDYAGDDEVAVEVCDSQGRCQVVDIPIEVAPQQDAPLAVDDAYTVAVGSSATIDALANDSDPDGDPLTIESLDASTGLTATIVDNRIRFRAPSSPGKYSIRYVVADAADNRATATVTLNVFDPATIGTPSTTTTTVSTSSGGGATPTSTSTTVRSTPSTAAPTTTAPSTTAAPTTVAPDTTVPTTVPPTTTTPPTAPPTTPPPNMFPVAAADPATVDEDATIVIPVLANDNDPDGDPLSIAAVSAPSNGSAVASFGETMITYTPDPDFSGSDTFEYKVSDGQGGTAMATVSVTVTPLNDPPVASATNGSVLESAAPGVGAGSVSASDPEGDALTFAIVAGDPSSQFSIDGSGQILVAGPLDFETTPLYTLTVDVDDGTDTTSVTVDVSISDVNEAPSNASSSLTVDEGSAQSTGDLTALHTDPEGDVLTVTSVTGAGANSLSVTTDGSSITYTHDGTETTADTVTYEVTDSAGNTATGTIAVTVNPVNDPPVVDPVADQAAFVNVAFSVATAVSDVDGTVNTVIIDNVPPGLTTDYNLGTGMVTISGTPSRPALGNTYTVTITAIDNNLAASTPETFDIVVDPIGRSPFAGQIVISEVLYAESDPYNPAFPFAAYLMDEYMELTNTTGSTINFENFYVTDTVDPATATDFQFHTGVPPYLPQHTGRINQHFAQSTPVGAGQVVTAPVRRPTWINYRLQDGSLRPAIPFSSWFRGTAYGFPAGQNSNWEAFENSGDELWFWDPNDLLVAFVAWDDGSGIAHIASRPPVELGLWDSTAEGRLAGATPGQSISLAPGTDNFTSTCWELTASGDAAADGCAGAATTRDVDPPGVLPPPVLQNRISSQGVPN